MDIRVFKSIIESSIDIKRRALDKLSETVEKDLSEGRYNTAAFNAAEARGYQMVIDQLEYLRDIIGEDVQAGD